MFSALYTIGREEDDLDNDSSRGHLLEREASKTVDQRILSDLGYFGHYLHVNVGGRAGKQNILVKLYRAGGTISQRYLQETVPISSASLSEVLSKLEGQGLVSRTRSDQDRRQLNVTLTPEGERAAIECARKKEAFESRMLSVLDEDEKRDLAHTLDRLVDHWVHIEQEETGGKRCRN
jgi:DNA-binding MarR family transcriptional regulator